MITCTFQVHNFKKNVFLGPLKSSKNNYAQKVHSDWFICPKDNNRTKESSGRVGKSIVSAFFGWLWAAQGNGGVFYTGSYGRHRCRWVNYDVHVPLHWTPSSPGELNFNRLKKML